jgi:serine protease inhibitor
MVSTPGKIVLPRFRIDYGTDLKPALAGMGMDLAFDQSGKADFSNLCTGVRGPVFIANVLHKTLLDVNEQGTTAAAATEVEIEGRGMPADQPEPFEMIVNRPFFCAIVDRDTGTILFLGAIVNPQVIPAPVAVPAVVPPTTGGATPRQQPPVQRQRRGFTRPGPPQRNGPQGNTQAPHP